VKPAPDDGSEAAKIRTRRSANPPLTDERMRVMKNEPRNDLGGKGVIPLTKRPPPDSRKPEHGANP